MIQCDFHIRYWTASSPCKYINGVYAWDMSRQANPGRQRDDTNTKAISLGGVGGGVWRGGGGGAALTTTMTEPDLGSGVNVRMQRGGPRICGSAPPLPVVLCRSKAARGFIEASLHSRALQNI